jgi:hypothetical protein
MIDAADRLYSLPLEEFIAERDALAKKLRGEGRRDDADVVKALRKPTVTVWAVNQVMRTQRKAARSLLEAADRAAAKPSDRDALSAHRVALEELTTAAAGLLSGKGRALSDDALLRVRDALHAGSLDRDLRDDFAAGRLTTEPAPVGFGALTGKPDPAPARRPARKAKPKPEPKPKQPSPAARKRVQRAETRVAKARAALADAESDLAEARAALAAEQG